MQYYYIDYVKLLVNSLSGYHRIFLYIQSVHAYRCVCVCVCVCLLCKALMHKNKYKYILIRAIFNL